MIGRKLLHYRLLDLAGKGAMGEVYRAEDERLKRTVAVKILPEELEAEPERLERFQREAEALAQLEHPNIVTIYSVDEDDGRHFLTMAWVEGETLEEAIVEGGLDLEAFLDIAVPLADAVAAAHRKGITHRDLKPANIMLTRDGTLKVLDFGLARSLGQVGGSDTETQTLTTHGTLIGSLPYMSPEQVRGETADPRSDVFALGVILYELATGVRPFQGATSSDLLSSILRDSPPPVDEIRPEFPHQLGRIIRRCLHKETDRRYETAGGLRNELLDFRAEGVEAETRKQTIAVLPFVDMSPDRDQEYFCEGIAEEILNALSSVGSIAVAARASSFLFRDRTVDLREIGARLRVESILDGSVRKAGGRVRITAQLVDVANGYQMWSERYDRELIDIFAIQDEIAESVLEAVAPTLLPRQKESLKRPTAKVEAYEYYLRGRSRLEELSESGLRAALEMFEKAVAIDARYSPAWSGIAEVHCWLYAWYGTGDESLDEAARASRRAIEFAPDSAEARTSWGYVLSLRGEYASAEAEFERAIEINPRHFDAFWHYGRHRYQQGDTEGAIELLGKAAAVRPEDYQALVLQSQFYGSIGEREKERVAAERALERARRRLELNPREARARAMGASVLLHLGRREESFEWCERALELDQENLSTLYNVACCFALAGETDRALDCLERALEHSFGFRTWIEHDSDFDSLRSHPRFKALLSG